LLFEVYVKAGHPAIFELETEEGNFWKYVYMLIDGILEKR